MARNKAEPDTFSARMAKLKQVERHPQVSDVLAVRAALWGAGLCGQPVRGSGVPILTPLPRLKYAGVGQSGLARVMPAAAVGSPQP